MPKKSVSVRLEESTIQRIDQLTSADFGRTQVITRLIDDGLILYEICGEDCQLNQALHRAVVMYAVQFINSKTRGGLLKFLEVMSAKNVITLALIPLVSIFLIG